MLAWAIIGFVCGLFLSAAVIGFLRMRSSRDRRLAKYKFRDHERHSLTADAGILGKSKKDKAADEFR